MSPWAKIDDHYPEHPKALQVGPLGVAMHIAAICYACRQLTDGFVQANMVPRLADIENWREVAQSLVDAVLLEPVQGGYQIHDFHDYNPSRTEVMRLRQDRARAGRAGGMKSVEARRSRAEASPEALASATDQPIAEASALANHQPLDEAEAQANFNPVPVPVPVPTPEPEPTENSLGADAPVRVKYSPAFEIFWSKWNDGITKGRGSKKAAFDAWKTVGLDRSGAAESRQELLEGLRRWKQSPGWQEEAGRFIPHAQKWLKELRWQDDPPSPISEERMDWQANGLQESDSGRFFALGTRGKEISQQ